MSPPCLGCLSDSQPAEPGIVAVNAFATAALLFANRPRDVGIYLGSLCDKHRDICAQTIAWTAKKNGLDGRTLMTRLETIMGIRLRSEESPPLPAFTCPKCSAVSHNENDVREGYCGRCHDLTGPRA